MGKRGLVIGLFFRYIILIALPLFSFLIFQDFLGFFYFIFTPLTIWPTVFILKFFYSVNVLGNLLIITEGVKFLNIKIIEACIAGSAYSLLLILNLTTPSMNPEKRIQIFLFDSLLLLLMNIVRIIILIAIGLNYPAFLDTTHKFFWYGISTIYIVFIWILSIYLFKIKEIPIYSDIKFLISNINRKNQKRKR